MLALHLCDGARILTVNRVVIPASTSHNRRLQTPKEDEEIPVVLPERWGSVVGLDGACRERFRFGGQIDLGVDVRGLDGDVSEPRADGIDVDAGAQQVRRGRVPNRVGADPLALEARHVGRRVARMADHEIMHTESRHRLRTPVDEDRCGVRSTGDERFQGGGGPRPERTPPHFRSFAHQAYGGLMCIGQVEVADGEASDFVGARAGVVEKEEDRVVPEAESSRSVGRVEERVHLWFFKIRHALRAALS